MFFQYALYLGRTHALLCHLFGFQHGLLLGDRNPLVIHYLDFAVKVLCQHVSRLTGTAQAAGHRDMDNLIIFFQHLVPQIHHISRSRLRCLDIHALPKSLIKFFLSQGNILKIQLLINIERHRQHVDPILPCLILCDSAVAICNYCNFSHNESFHDF